MTPSALDDSLALRLRAIASELGLPLPAEQAGQLLRYLGLLQKWNRTYNLSAVREPEHMLTQHLADCLAVVAPLRRHLGAAAAAKLLDVGSGGGLPGVVLAVLNPQWDVHCLDAVGKKTAFVRQVAAELRLPNLRAEHARVEAFPTVDAAVVISRAFASLALFTRLTRQHLGAQGVWLAMKGQTPDAEMAELPSDTAVFHVEQLNVPQLDGQRCLVWMRPR